MKKPNPAPAPTPLEMAQRILEAQALEAAAYQVYVDYKANVRFPDAKAKLGKSQKYHDWCAVRDTYIGCLTLFGPQVATAYVSLHARNVAPSGATALTVGEMESYQALRDSVRAKLPGATPSVAVAAKWFRLTDVLDEADATHRAYAALYARNLELAAEALPVETAKDAQIRELRERVEALEALHTEFVIVTEPARWPFSIRFTDADHAIEMARRIVTLQRDTYGAEKPLPFGVASLSVVRVAPLTPPVDVAKIGLDEWCQHGLFSVYPGLFLSGQPLPTAPDA